MLAFVRPYLAKSDQSWLVAHGADAKIEYLEYSWKLNDRKKPSLLQ